MGFDIRNGILFRYIEEPFQTDIIIPDGVTEIGGDSFRFKKHLKSIVIPDSVKTIGNHAFRACMSLESITFTDSINAISKNAFDECFEVQKITYCGKTIDYPYNVNDIMMILVKRCIITMKLSQSLSTAVFILWLTHPQEKPIVNYIRRNFTKLFEYIITYPHAELIQNILDQGDFVTDQNIDIFIRYAIDQKQHENYITLLEYKNQKIGYTDTEAIINKKFSL